MCCASSRLSAYFVLNLRVVGLTKEPFDGIGVLSMYALLRLFSIFFWLIPAISHAGAIHDAAKKGDVADIAAALDAGATSMRAMGWRHPFFMSSASKRLNC
jgi:hypothetical protein